MLASGQAGRAMVAFDEALANGAGSLLPALCDSAAPAEPRPRCRHSGSSSGAHRSCRLVDPGPQPVDVGIFRRSRSSAECTPLSGFEKLVGRWSEEITSRR
jgi:hypothetical protein